jgi:hypothetical protein
MSLGTVVSLTHGPPSKREHSEVVTRRQFSEIIGSGIEAGEGINGVGISVFGGDSVGSGDETGLLVIDIKSGEGGGDAIGNPAVGRVGGGIESGFVVGVEDGPRENGIGEPKSWAIVGVEGDPGEKGVVAAESWVAATDEGVWGRLEACCIVLSQ